VLTDGGQVSGYPKWHIITIKLSTEDIPISIDSLLIDAQTPKQKIEKVLFNPPVGTDPDLITENLIWNDPRFTALLYMTGRVVTDVETRYLIKFGATSGTDYKANITLDTWCPTNKTMTIQGHVP
jgi:hypothetical protein